MTPEQILEEIMLLDEREQARLFALARQRPLLRRVLGGGAQPDPIASNAPPVTDSSADYLIIWDGGSRGNPGQGYGSFQITAVAKGKSRIETREFPGRMTNNEAEYETLISALEMLAAKLRERGLDPRSYILDLRGDSLLVINQILGKWKAKDRRMAAYRDQTRTLLEQFGGHTLRHHDRSHSVAALGH